jgi:hypothetical protein
LSQEDIDAQVAGSGRVHYPSERTVEVLEKEFNLEVEIQRALDAFLSGRVVMFVGDKQVHELDEMVMITERIKVKFLRITPLVGG